MGPAARASARRLLAIAGAVVVAALTTPAAAMPLMEATATRPRTPAPAFVLDKGRYTGFDALAR